MKYTVLALIAVTATSAAAQVNGTIATGFPIGTIRGGGPNPPTLPLRTPVRPTREPTLQQRRPTHVTYIPAPLQYYGYPQQPDQNLSVNVTNVIETPPAVTVFAPIYTQVPTLAQAQWWDPNADIAAERAEQNAAALANMDPDRSRGQAEADDVKSVDAIVGAMYDVLSGPRGTPRNWDRFRSLFADGARLITTTSGASGPARPALMSPAEYADIAAPVLERGVFEKEVSKSVEKFGAIAQVFSTYECRHTSGDVKPYQRGINSIQLMNDGTRWWITTVSWDSERTDNPIPAKYLPPAPVSKR